MIFLCLFLHLLLLHVPQPLFVVLGLVVPLSDLHDLDCLLLGLLNLLPRLDSKTVNPMFILIPLLIAFGLVGSTRRRGMARLSA